jgi:hypothetical protein
MNLPLDDLLINDKINNEDMNIPNDNEDTNLLNGNIKSEDIVNVNNKNEHFDWGGDENTNKYNTNKWNKEKYINRNRGNRYNNQNRTYGKTNYYTNKEHKTNGFYCHKCGYFNNINHPKE